MDKIEEGKCRCELCGWKGKCEDVLHSRNPFDSSGIIDGCPECKSIDSIIVVCDEPGCWSICTCGSNTKVGYRTTCLKHRPERDI